MLTILFVVRERKVYTSVGAAVIAVVIESGVPLTMAYGVTCAITHRGAGYAVRQAFIPHVQVCALFLDVVNVFLMGVL
jgi:hypothetical protein